MLVGKGSADVVFHIRTIGLVSCPLSNFCLVPCPMKQEKV
jgi:hypothetical protein